MASSTIKALRALGKTKVIPLKLMRKHMQELTGKNDRLVAVVCGSLVEGSFEALLKDYMPNNAHQELFNAQKPLSSFSAKIDLSWALGLIDAKIRRDAHTMREVRNIFAHKVAPISFKTKEVADACKLLTLGKRQKNYKEANTSMRTRFMLAAVSIGGELAYRRISNPYAKPTPISLP